MLDFSSAVHNAIAPQHAEHTPEQSACGLIDAILEMLKTDLPFATRHTSLCRHNGYPLHSATPQNEWATVPAGLLACSSGARTCLPNPRMTSVSQWRYWVELAAYSCGVSLGLDDFRHLTEFPVTRP